MVCLDEMANRVNREGKPQSFPFLSISRPGCLIFTLLIELKIRLSPAPKIDIHMICIHLFYDQNQILD